VSLGAKDIPGLTRGNRGSNPLGDAKLIQGISDVVNPFIFCSDQIVSIRNQESRLEPWKLSERNIFSSRTGEFYDQIEREEVLPSPWEISGSSFFLLAVEFSIVAVLI
jgi:hypothetical protein